MHRSLAAAFAAAVALLASAPAAHAGWLTAGNSMPPVVSDELPCTNGMVFRWATLGPNAPRTWWPSSLPLANLTVLDARPASYNSAPDPDHVIHQASYA